MRQLSDALVRRRTRWALARRLRSIRPGSGEDPAARRRATLQSVETREAVARAEAVLARGALPLAFWQRVLGAHMSAASGFWPRWAKDTDRAEREWLELVARRAGLAEGQRVLEIGASFGAVARWADSELPGLEVTVAAADPARHTFLDRVLEAHGPASAVPAPPSHDSDGSGRFDRILVIEAFSGFANPVPLLHDLISRLAPGGRLFLQTSCHWRTSYFFERGDENRWLFDTPDGALMPGEELFTALREEIPILDRWELSGEHVERTVRAWRVRMDQQRAALRRILSDSADPHPARTLKLWRNALLAQEAMFGFRGGQEWALTQLLIGKPSP